MIKNVSTTLKKFGMEKTFDYVYKDPEKNLVKIMDWADQFAGKGYGNRLNLSPESVEHLCAQCDAYAKNWQPVADELWEASGRARPEGKN